MIKKLFILVLLCPFLYNTNLSAQDAVPIDPQFSRNLVVSSIITGVQVIPPADTDIAAVAGLFLNGNRNEIVVNLYANNFSGNLTEVVIREGSAVEDGDIVMDLTDRIEGKKINTILKSISKEFVSKLLRGKYYIEIKTDNFDGVAARGDLELETEDSYVGLVNAENILDNASDSPARGIVSSHHTPGRLEVNFFASDLSSEITGATLRRGNTETEDGEIVADLMEFVTDNRIFAELDPVDFVQSLSSNEIYIEIYTEDFPDGEIRGHLVYTDQLVHDGWFSGAQVVDPEPNNTGITGFSVFILHTDFKRADYWIFTEGLEEDMSEILLHSALQGESSVFVYNFTSNIDGKVAFGSLTHPSLPKFASSMLAGYFYVNISTENFPNKVRGQLYRVARDGHLYNFCSNQISDDINTDADGGGIIAIGRKLDHSHLIFTSHDLSNTINNITLNKGGFGEEGELLVDLTPVSQLRFTNWYWNSDYDEKGFDANVAEDVKTSNAFFKYANATYPDGEIRGQVLSQLNCENRFNESADLELELEVSRVHYAQYDSLAFTYTVSNNGFLAAEDIKIYAPLPDGFVYCYSLTEDGEYNLYYSTWNIETLAPGETVELRIVNLAMSSGNNINYFTQVSNSSAFDHDSTPGNDQNMIADEDDEAGLTIYAIENGGSGTGDFDVDLELNLVADQMTAGPYKNVNYTATITNTGSDYANNIVTNVTIPPGLAHTSHSYEKGVVTLHNGRWFLQSLAPGESAELNLELFTLWPSSTIRYFIQVHSVDEPDKDSTPGNVYNFIATEDDEARVDITTVAQMAPGPQFNVVDLLKLNKGKVFPNPAKGNMNFVIQSGIDASGEVIIYNTAGQIVHKELSTFSQGFNEFNYDVSNFPVGTYFIKVPELEITSRFIKM